MTHPAQTACLPARIRGTGGRPASTSALPSQNLPKSLLRLERTLGIAVGGMDGEAEAAAAAGVDLGGDSARCRETRSRRHAAAPPGSQRHGGRVAWSEDTFGGRFKV